MHVSGNQSVRFTELKFHRKQLNKWLIVLWNYPERTRMQIFAPIVSGRKGTHVKLLEDIKKQGYVRVRVNGEMIDLR